MNCPCCGQAIPVNVALQVDEAGIVVHAGSFVILSKSEAEIFASLRAAQGQIVSREQLLAGLYMVGADEAEIKIIDVHICKLRAKLKPLGLSIQTAWGRGFRFVPPAAEGARRHD